MEIIFIQDWQKVAVSNALSRILVSEMPHFSFYLLLRYGDIGKGEQMLLFKGCHKIAWTIDLLLSLPWILMQFVIFCWARLVDIFIFFFSIIDFTVNINVVRNNWWGYYHHQLTSSGMWTQYAFRLSAIVYSLMALVREILARSLAHRFWMLSRPIFRPLSGTWLNPKAIDWKKARLH